MSGRGGHTLAELVVAMPLTLLLAAMVVGGLVAQSRLARLVGDRASRAEADRIAATLLPDELRWAAEADLRGSGPDSVRARIFRGYGLPCPQDPTAVRWSGLRVPEPDKDSLLIVGTGSEQAVDLQGAQRHDRCGGYVLQAGTSTQSSLVLVFETGTYYLRDGALRFRAGAEGRQPLTGEWLDDPSTALLRDAHGTPRAVQLGLRSPGPDAAVELRRVGWAMPNARVEQ